LGKYKDAISDYNKAIEYSEEYADAYVSRGIAKKQLELYEEAVEDCNNALNINQKYIPSIINKASVRISTGSFQRAAKDAKEGLELSSETNTRVLCLLFYIISRIMSKEETQSEEQEFRELCGQDFTTL
jgi:tetratricopeptide (TPR) repeat protein